MPRALTLFLLLSLAAPAVRPETLELPARRELSETTIAVEVDFASVEVVVDETATTATVEAGLYPQYAGHPGLDLALDGGVARLRRAGLPKASATPPLTSPAGPAGAEVPVWLALVVGPEHKVEIRGQRLNLLYEAPGRIRPGALELDVVGSEVRLVGAGDVEAKARGSNVGSSDSRGRLVCELDDATLNVARHVGPIQLEGRKGDVNVLSHQGRLRFELEESSLDVVDSADTVDGRIDGGHLLLSVWQGTATLAGGDAAVDVRDAGSGSSVTIGGTALTVTVNGLIGTFDAELDGGSLTGFGLVGHVHVVGRQAASVDLEELDKAILIELTGGSNARLRRNQGRISVKLTDSTLTSDDARMLGVTALRSEVNVTRVAHLDTVTATDSRLVLDLVTVENYPALLLKGRSTAQVRLPSPCMVRSAGKLAERSVKVAGCTLHVPGVTPPEVRGSEVLVLKAMVDPESLLEVESAARIRP